QIALVEGVGVDDERGAGREIADVGLQRRRVHRHQHAGRIAGREDVVVGDVDLEGRDARQRARGGTDLCGEVGQGGEVVAEYRAHAGKAVAGELHAVAGVTGEADDDPVELLQRVLRSSRVGHDFRGLSG